MLSKAAEKLRRLQRSLSGRAEHAYEDRDKAPEGGRAEAYAEGEGHAYGVASDAARDAAREEVRRGTET